MQNNFLLGISVGEAFAEYCLLEGRTVIATKRSYLSREGLKSSLNQFILNHSDKKIGKAAVSIRVPEKLLDYKLNGAVAHVTTKGFEQWLDLNVNPLTNFTTDKLQFSICERVHSNGEIAIAIENSELEAISNKLKELGAKKVCVHLLHASINSSNQEKVQLFLQAQGFEVFLPEKSENGDEVSRWKRNSLKATVTSLFEDIKKDIQDALHDSISAENIYYLNAAGDFSQDKDHNPIAGLSASYSALALTSTKPDFDILYLGLENFILISPKKWQTHWQSPWGSIENRHLGFRSLSIQPTLEIALNAFRHFDFSETSEGWEPGPMFLGRGQKATLLDLWSDSAKLRKIDGLRERSTESGIQRFKKSLYTLAKTSKSHEKEIDHVNKELQSLAIQKIAMEALLFRNGKKILITGPLADMFGNGFKKDPHSTVEINEFALSNSVALLGQTLLNPS